MKRAAVDAGAAPHAGVDPAPSHEEWPADVFGEHLARELRARNWTLRYFALRAGVSHSTISRLIQGRRLPTLATARRLHAALGGPDPLMFFGGSIEARLDPVRRVEKALWADPDLDRAAVGEVLQHYLRLHRTKRAADMTPRPAGGDPFAGQAAIRRSERS